MSSSLPSTTGYAAAKADRVAKRRAEMERQMALMEEAGNASLMDAMADTGLNPHERYDGSKERSLDDGGGSGRGRGEQGGGGNSFTQHQAGGGKSSVSSASSVVVDPDKAERAAKRRAEMERQMALMEEAANVSLMDVMAKTGLNPHEQYDGSRSSFDDAIPNSSQRSVGSEDQTGASSSGNTEASSTNGEELEPPPLSHDQIRENARRFLDDNGDSPSFRPASAKNMGGINAPPSSSSSRSMGAAGQGSSRSVVERAKQFLFDGSPPGSASGSARSVSQSVTHGSSRSVPGLAFGGTLNSSVSPGMMSGSSSSRWSNSPDKSTSPDRRRVYSTKKYGESMRDSMRNLFNQVQARLQQQEAIQESKRTGSGQNSGGGGLVGISLWSKRGLNDSSGFSDDETGAAADNLAPRGTGVMGTLASINLGNKGNGKGGKGGGHNNDSSGRDLAYDPDNDEESCLERLRYSCWECCNGAGHCWKQNVAPCCRSNTMLILMVFLIAGSVVAVFMEVYDGEKAFVASERGDSSDNGSEVAQDMMEGAFGDDLEELPQLDAASGLRFGRIKERIIESGVSSDHVLTYEADSGVAPTAQFRALAWISAEDPASLDVEDEFLLQRYALAVLWYSTYETPSVENSEGGALNEWADRTDWMTAKGLCSWYGISCHHRPGTSPSQVKYDGNNGVTVLNLTDNDVAGTLPPEVFLALSDLRRLDLSDNYLSGNIPDQVGEATDLESLHLWGNDIEGSLPTQLGRLTSVRSLDLHDNLFEGPIPTQLGDMTGLHNLGLHSNYLTGSVPTQFGKFERVRDVYLDSNKLSGPLPPQLLGLSKLVDLRVRENELTGQFQFPSDIMTEIASSDLELLYADGNKFTGTLPAALGSLAPRLAEVRLERNAFVGSLPPEWGAALADLRELRLEGNRLTGSLPPQWGSMVDLRVLDVAGNGMSGIIPTELGQMVELRELNLNDNGSIEGSVPSELGNSFNLEILHLHNNKLTDNLPSAIGSLNHLKTMKIHGNAISGTVPAEVCSLTESDDLEELTADCGGDSPSVRCECCSECFDNGAGAAASSASGGAGTESGSTRP